MSKKFITSIFILAITWVGYAQRLSMKVGTNPTQINTSAALEVESNTKGFLPPRMTNDEMKAIVNPIDGLIVYNTTLGCLAYYKSGSFNCTHNPPTSPAPAAPLGSTYSSLFNGITGGGVSVNNALSNYGAYTTTEKFSNNTNCTDKFISAQGCGGLTQVTGSSGTIYPLVNINGQCWFSTNLQEKPNNFANYTTTSWLNTSPGDLGYWGYFNTTTTNGSIGWGTTAPAGEGYLYQWNAAMNNSSAERAQGACPSGFHIPSDCEWMYLEHGQGMALIEQVLVNAWRAETTDSQGTPGLKMRTVVSGISYANASGFSSLMPGGRATDGTFFVRGTNVGYWTSTAGGTTTAYQRSLGSGSRGVYRFINNKSYAFSVRCLKD